MLDKGVRAAPVEAAVASVGEAETEGERHNETTDKSPSPAILSCI
jgi:hypothetical protein